MWQWPGGFLPTVMNILCLLFFVCLFGFLYIILPLLAQTKTGQDGLFSLPEDAPFVCGDKERALFMQLSLSILCSCALVQYITVAIGMC